VDGEIFKIKGFHNMLFTMVNLTLKPRLRAAHTQLGQPLQNTRHDLVPPLQCKSFQKTTPYLAYGASSTGSTSTAGERGRFVGVIPERFGAKAVVEDGETSKSTASPTPRQPFFLEF